MTVAKFSHLYLGFLLILAGIYKSPLYFANRGGHVGNAGDELKQIFRWTKEELPGEISRMNHCSFPIRTADQVIEFVLSNNEQLAIDIKNSAHLWPESVDQAACAMTLSQRNSDTTLSTNKCEKSTNTRNKVKRLLVHESIHHFIEGDFYKDFETVYFADILAEAVL